MPPKKAQALKKVQALKDSPALRSLKQQSLFFTRSPSPTPSASSAGASSVPQSADKDQRRTPTGSMVGSKAGASLGFTVLSDASARDESRAGSPLATVPPGVVPVCSPGLAAKKRSASPPQAMGPSGPSVQTRGAEVSAARMLPMRIASSPPAAPTTGGRNASVPVRSPRPPVMKPAPPQEVAGLDMPRGRSRGGKAPLRRGTADGPQIEPNRVSLRAVEDAAKHPGAVTYGKELLKSRVSVFFEKEDTWYDGEIKDFGVDERHFVQ